jgi:DNA repair exonuclease SbcCD ATPase subunit
MNMSLKSFPKFQKHEEKINKQLQTLQGKIDKTQQEIAALTQDYVSKFADGVDPSGVGSKLRELNAQSEALKSEMDIVDNHDFKERQLAKEVHAEFLALTKEVQDETERVWQQSEQMKDELEAAINKMNEYLHDIHFQLNTVATNQLAPVIDHLEGDKVKNNLRIKIFGGGISGYSAIRNIRG